MTISMIFSRLCNKRGMALLITIMVLSLLIAITVQFNRNVRQSFFSSASQLEGERLFLVARSGIFIGEALLEADGLANGYDSFYDSWALLTDDSLVGLFPQSSLRLAITDYSGKLQVNSLVADSGGDGSGEPQEKSNDNRGILKRLLLSGNFDIEGEQQADEIVDAIVDWLDPDDRESDYGAESSYYQSLDPPYMAANTHFSVIEELLLVKGITPRLLFGDQNQPGLADYLTVYGDDGKININTAPEPLLQALHPLLTEEMAKSLIEYRQQEENRENLEKADWYQHVAGWPGDIVLPEQVISTRSFFFALRAEGVYEEQQRRLLAVVERRKDASTACLYTKME